MLSGGTEESFRGEIAFDQNLKRRMSEPYLSKLGTGSWVGADKGRGRQSLWPEPSAQCRNAWERAVCLWVCVLGEGWLG